MLIVPPYLGFSVEATGTGACTAAVGAGVGIAAPGACVGVGVVGAGVAALGPQEINSSAATMARLVTDQTILFLMVLPPSSNNLVFQGLICASFRS